MKRFKDLNVSRQLMILMVLTSAMAVGLAMLAFGLIEFRFLEQRVRNNMGSLARIIGQNSSAALLFKDNRDALETLNSLQEEEHVLDAVLYLVTGEQFALYQRDALPDQLSQLPSIAPEKSPMPSDGHELVYQRILLDGEIVGHILIRYDLRDVTRQAVLMLSVGTACLAISLLLSSVLAHWLQRGISLPIREMAGTAERVADEGDYSLRVHPGQGKEVQILARSFNHMLEEIRNRDQKLVEYNQDLEERVRQRTKDLEEEMVIRQGVQQELQLRNDSFHNIISRNTEGVMVATKGIVRFSNPAAAAFLNSDVKSLLHQKVPFPVPEEGTTTLELTQKDLSKIPFDVRVIPTEWQKRPAKLILLQDIRIRQQLQEQLNQAQKSEIIGQFAGGVAHDFNNMLFVISGLAGHLTRELKEDGDPNLAKIVDEIHKAADKGAELTRQLLLFSRHQAYEASTINLNETLQGMMKILRRLIREDTELVTVLPEKELFVHGDSIQIQQVIMNLVVNARDALGRKGGGRCEVKIEELTAATSDGKRWVSLTVTDNGCGIPLELKDKIFEPFFTTKEKGQGTGLGLATVKAIVNRMDGRIILDSTLGTGTSFSSCSRRISLPGTINQQNRRFPALYPLTRKPPASWSSMMMQW